MRTDVSTERRHGNRSDTSVRVGSMAVTPSRLAQTTWAVTGAELHATTATASGTLQAWPMYTSQPYVWPMPHTAQARHTLKSVVSISQPSSDSCKR